MVPLLNRLDEQVFERIPVVEEVSLSPFVTRVSRNMMTHQPNESNDR